jgi:hypothetical protein
LLNTLHPDKALAALDAGARVALGDGKMWAWKYNLAVSADRKGSDLMRRGVTLKHVASFLRAGLLPRLQRDDRQFLPLPMVRPEGAALSGKMGFALCMETALHDADLKWTRAEVKAAVQGGAQQVKALLDQLAKKVRRRSVGGMGIPPPEFQIPGAWALVS